MTATRPFPDGQVCKDMKKKMLKGANQPREQTRLTLSKTFFKNDLSHCDQTKQTDIADLMRQMWSHWHYELFSFCTWKLISLCDNNTLQFVTFGFNPFTKWERLVGLLYFYYRNYLCFTSCIWDQNNHHACNCHAYQTLMASINHSFRGTTV